VSFAVTLWVARVLGDEQFGVYSFALALGYVLAQAADMGIKVVLTREVAVGARRARALVRRGLSLKLLLCIPVLAAVLSVALARPVNGRVVVAALGTAMIVLTFVDFAAHVFRGCGDIAEDVRLTAGAALILAAATAAALLANAGLAGIALAYLCGAVLAAAIALVRLSRDRWLAAPWAEATGRPSKAASTAAGPARGLLRAALPLGVATFLSIAYLRLPIFVLQRLSGEAAVAHFSVAQRFVEAAQLIPAAAMAAVFPAYAALRLTAARDAARLAMRAGALLLTAGTAVAAAFHAAGPWLVTTLFGTGYRRGGDVLVILGLCVPLLFVNYLLLHLLIARGRQNVVTVLNGGILVLHAVLCWQLISLHGPRGAAVAVLISETTLLLGAAASLVLIRPTAGLISTVEAAR
jgi:O-antigen/teichoic acid export membrane protein